MLFFSGILFLLIIGGFSFFKDSWPGLLPYGLLLPLSLIIWAIASTRSLFQICAIPIFKEKLLHFREVQKIRYFFLFLVFAAGNCIAVFTSARSLNLPLLYLGLASAVPAGLCYLAEMGLGLQCDWLYHSLDKKT